MRKNSRRGSLHVSVSSKTRSITTTSSRTVYSQNNSPVELGLVSCIVIAALRGSPPSPRVEPRLGVAVEVGLVLGVVAALLGPSVLDPVVRGLACAAFPALSAEPHR